LKKTAPWADAPSRTGMAGLLASEAKINIHEGNHLSYKRGFARRQWRRGGFGATRQPPAKLAIVAKKANDPKLQIGESP
jgi:hypothetical protein